MTKLTIAVFGTAGAGGYFGGRLAEVGEDVRFIARGAHLAAIREHGLWVESELGRGSRFFFTVPQRRAA